jgi:hypothetical protein
MKMRRNTSTLLEDKDAIPGLLQNMPDIDSLFTRHTPEEIGAILDSMLSGDKSAESRSRETTQYNQSGKSSVDKAFNDLMTG